MKESTGKKERVEGMKARVKKEKIRNQQDMNYQVDLRN